MSDDTRPSYTQKKNYDSSNPIEGFYDGLRSQDDASSWNKNDDDNKFDEGMWFNSYTKPRYEIANRKSLEEILRRLKAGQTAENYYY